MLAESEWRPKRLRPSELPLSSDVDKKRPGPPCVDRPGEVVS